MCLTLASLFGLLLGNICTCSIHFPARRISFLSLSQGTPPSLTTPRPPGTFCPSDANAPGGGAGEELFWGGNVHRHRSVEGIHVLVHCFSHLCECEFAPRGPLRSAAFGFITANMMQHFILPAVWDMVLSEALFGINSGSTADGKLADTLADRREEGVSLNTLYKLGKIEILTTALLYLFCLSGNRVKLFWRQLNTFLNW